MESDAKPERTRSSLRSPERALERKSSVSIVVDKSGHADDAGWAASPDRAGSPNVRASRSRRKSDVRADTSPCYIISSVFLRLIDFRSPLLPFPLPLLAHPFTRCFFHPLFSCLVPSTSCLQQVDGGQDTKGSPAPASAAAVQGDVTPHDGTARDTGDDSDLDEDVRTDEQRAAASRLLKPALLQLWNQLAGHKCVFYLRHLFVKL
jgi:hypothetical protein